MIYNRDRVRGYGMASLFRDKRGLSQVVTTLILLVVSVLLAGVVVFYATNVTSARTQQEEVNIKNAHIWVCCNESAAQAAFVLQNLGGRDIVIDMIQIRGVEVPWSSVYINTTAGVTESLEHISGCSGNPGNYTTVSKDICVPSGTQLIVYIDSPDNVSCDDIGCTLSITVHTTRACYIEEVNVQAAQPY